MKTQLVRLVMAAGLALGAVLAAQAVAAQTTPSQATAPASAAASAAQGGAVPTDHDPLTARREVDLAMQLRCLVCQNQSIAESNAELAQDLRRQIREQIAAGRSDAEIVDFMTARYGDFVLYRPPFKMITLLLWVGPLLLLVAGVLVARRVVQGSRGRADDLPMAEADRARAERLLAGDAPAAVDVAAPRSKR
jgi:cytochrome c-type biogenesis protein CcmH